MLISEVMTAPAVTVSPDTTIQEALRLLDDHQITTLPVVDRHGALTGIISEADLLADAGALDVPAGSSVRLSIPGAPRRVGELMTRLVVTVSVDGDLDEAVDLMTSTMIKSLPVIENDRVVGVVSRSDIIHLLATRDQRIRRHVTDLLHDESDWLVDVYDAEVVITGPDGEHERKVAEVLAGSVPGVVAVHVRRTA
jgi:CBS-domain-containing membrane protein